VWAGLCAGLALAVCASPGARGEGKKVAEGQPAPDIELPATQIEKILPEKKDAKTLKLKDLQGKKNVVLYFFPKALTKG
jgi:peroxiredoxin